MQEAKIEKDVRTYAKLSNWKVFKFVSPAQRGVPDRLLLFMGYILFIEFKAPGKKLSPLQKLKIKEMQNAGAHVEIIDNIDKGKRLINEITKGLKAGTIKSQSICQRQKTMCAIFKNGRRKNGNSP